MIQSQWGTFKYCPPCLWWEVTKKNTLFIRVINEKEKPNSCKSLLFRNKISKNPFDLQSCSNFGQFTINRTASVKGLLDPRDFKIWALSTLGILRPGFFELVYGMYLEYICIFVILHFLFIYMYYIHVRLHPTLYIL